MTSLPLNPCAVIWMVSLAGDGTLGVADRAQADHLEALMAFVCGHPGPVSTAGLKLAGGYVNVSTLSICGVSCTLYLF